MYIYVYTHIHIYFCLHVCSLQQKRRNEAILNSDRFYRSLEILTENFVFIRHIPYIYIYYYYYSNIIARKQNAPLMLLGGYFSYTDITCIDANC